MFISRQRFFARARGLVCCFAGFGRDQNGTIAVVFALAASMMVMLVGGAVD